MPLKYTYTLSAQNKQDLLVARKTLTVTTDQGPVAVILASQVEFIGAKQTIQGGGSVMVLATIPATNRMEEVYVKG